MSAKSEMLSVTEALARVTDGFELIASEHISLSEALSRVLAEDVVARLTQPPVAVSSMDGYAVRGESQAGGGFKGTIGAGECTRIFTGAPLPDGADAVVIQEETDVDGTQICVNESVKTGAYIRPAGLDFQTGDVLLKAGKLLTARDVGLTASMNVPWLRVRRRPRVALIATGDEIVMPGDPLGADQIISSNSLSLSAFVRVLGGTPVNLGIARDTEVSLRKLLAGVKGVDLLVTIGGASVGDYDLVRRVLGTEGLDLNFYKVAMRPGKPLIFGTWDGIPLLGLPGNPVSAGVTSAIFLRAAMEVMLGTSDGALRTETVRLGRDLPQNGIRQDFMRATLRHDTDGQLCATPFERQDSAMMASFAAADCLVVRAPEAPAAKAGDLVLITRLDTGMSRF